MEERPEVLRLMRRPERIGHQVGFRELTKMHGDWIKAMVFGEEDYTLQAHRGSFKSSCLAVAIALLMVLYPKRNIIFLRKADNSQLLSFLQNEHPQTIALVMAYLDPQQAGIIMTGLPIDSQADVAKRIALMDRTSPDVVREIERVLEKKLSSMSMQDFTSAGGVQAVVEILNRVDRGTERAIIESLEVDNPELAEEIKQLMFVFEDIVMLDDRSVQIVLREVDTKELALAMKATNDDVTAKIYKNMSKRAADMLKEELSYMGPVKIRDVEEAQSKIVNVIRTLEDKGVIVIVRGQGEGMLV